MTGVKTDVAVKIFGEDLEVLFDLANKSAAIIDKIDGAGDVKVDQIVGLPQLVVTFDRERMARYGLQIREVNDIIRTAFAGKASGFVFEGEKRFDIVVRLDESYRKNIDALRNLRINRPDEELILLSQVADIREVSGPLLISREETKRRATIGINVRNRDIESFITEVNSELSKNLTLPPGYFVTYGGQFENLETAKRTSAIAVPVALAAIFIMLFFAFHSFRQSVMVFTAIPLAAVGGIFALLIRGMPFSISAGVGFIALFGIAVLNGIVLVSHYNQLEKEGVSDILERIRRGTSDRLRPVIMTSLVAALGFIPMALSTAAGAEVQKPLATVVIGGIFTASMLTLVVLPVLYLTFHQGFRCAFRNLRLNRTVPPVVLLFLLIAIPSVFIKAQQEPTAIVLTLDQAIHLGRNNSIEIKNNELRKKASKAKNLSGFDLASPTVSLETGQINSALDDYKVLISQEIEFPMVYVEQVAVNRAEYRTTLLQSSLNTQHYLGTVMSVYMSWWITSERIRILEQQDSLLRVYHAAARKQFISGEISKSEVMLSESRVEKQARILENAKSDLIILGGDLRLLTGSDSSFVPPPYPPLKLDPDKPREEDVNDNLQVALLDSYLEMERSVLRKESWKLAPSFSVGWFTQSLDEVKPYTGWQYGISVPIWLWTPISRIRTARINRDIAMNEVEFGRLKFRHDLYAAGKELDKASGVLKYFEEKGIMLSESMIRSAATSYLTGEIGLLQYIIILNEAFDIRMEYLDAILEYNLQVIHIKQLLGKI